MFSYGSQCSSVLYELSSEPVQCTRLNLVFPLRRSAYTNRERSKTAFLAASRIFRSCLLARPKISITRTICAHRTHRKPSFLSKAVIYLIAFLLFYNCIHFFQFYYLQTFVKEIAGIYNLYVYYLIFY